MVNVEEIEKISESELGLLDHLADMLEYEHNNRKVESLNPEVVTRMKELAEKQREIARKLESAQRGKINKLLAVKHLLKEEEILEEDFRSGLKELEEEFKAVRNEDIPEDLTSHEDLEEKILEIIKKLESAQQAFARDIEDLKQAIRAELESTVKKRIRGALKEINSRPPILIEASEEHKLQDSANQSILENRETGGFLNFKRLGEDFLLDSFFQDPSELQKVEIDSINSKKDIKNLIVGRFGVPQQKFEQEWNSGTELEEEIEKIKERMEKSGYTHSSEVREMLEQFYDRENLDLAQPSSYR